MLKGGSTIQPPLNSTQHIKFRYLFSLAITGWGNNAYNHYIGEKLYMLKEKT